jgi:hypothetical protein
MMPGRGCFHPVKVYFRAARRADFVYNPLSTLYHEPAFYQRFCTCSRSPASAISASARICLFSAPGIRTAFSLSYNYLRHNLVGRTTGEEDPPPEAAT